MMTGWLRLDGTRALENKLGHRNFKVLPSAYVVKCLRRCSCRPALVAPHRCRASYPNARCRHTFQGLPVAHAIRDRVSALDLYKATSGVRTPYQTLSRSLHHQHQHQYFNSPCWAPRAGWRQVAEAELDALALGDALFGNREAVL